jgi:DNA repair protein RadC
MASDWANGLDLEPDQGSQTTTMTAPPPGDWATGLDLEPDRPDPQPNWSAGLNLEPDQPSGAIATGFHRIMNDVREFGSAAGKYIFHGLEGISDSQAHFLANPVPEMYQAQAEETLLPPEEQARREQERIDAYRGRVPDAEKTAHYWQLRAAQSDAQSGVDPQFAQTWDARISRTAGSAAIMGMEGLIPAAGVPIMAMNGAAAAEAEAHNAGKTPEEAESAGVRSLIGLGIFGGANKVAALGVAKLLPLGASRVTRFISQFFGQEVANELSSRSIDAWEAAREAPVGQKVAAATQAFSGTTLEASTLNAIYAGIGAAQEGGRPEPIGPDAKLDLEPTPAGSAAASEMPATGLRSEAMAPAIQTGAEVPVEQTMASPDVRTEQTEAITTPSPDVRTEQPAPVFRADESLPFMTRIRMEDELVRAGYQDAAIAGMTTPQVGDIVDQLRRQSETARTPTVPESQTTAPGESAPPSLTALPSPPARPLSAEDIAQRHYELELLQQAEQTQSDNGPELMDAVMRAGGLPSKTSDARSLYAGELDRLEEFARDPMRQASDVSPVTLFRKDAPGLDRLATSLRDRGFNVQRPDDVLNLLEQRFRTGRRIYGTPELARVMDGPERFGVAPNQIENYAKANGSANPPEAARDIAKIFNAAGNAAGERYEQPQLFAEARRPGAQASTSDVLANVPKALRLEDTAAAREAFSKSNVISSILPRMLTREIPGFNIRGKIVRTAQDFALLQRALRTPHFESLKVAFLDKNNQVLHSQILHVGTVNESVIGTTDLIKALRIARQRGDAVKMIQAHNHPSGDPTPSPQDKTVEKVFDRLAQRVGLQVVDHVITDGDSYYSAKSGRVTPFTQPQSLAPWEIVGRGQLKKIDRESAYQEMARFFRQVNPDASHVFYGNTKLALTAVERVPIGADLVRSILNGVGREAAPAVWVDFAPNLDPREALRVRSALDEANIRVVDMSTGSVRSFVEAGLLGEQPGNIATREEEQEPPVAHAMGAAGARIAARQPAAAAPAVAAAAAPVRSWWKQRTLGIRKLVAPQTIDEPANKVANIVRAYTGELANKVVQADHALAKARADFDRTPVPRNWKYDPKEPLPRNYAFIDNSERGGANLGPEDRQLKAQIDQMFSEAIDEVHRVRPDALQSLIQNYFPHIWKDPEQAKRVFATALSRRPLEGSKAFLRQRVLDYTVDGLKAGLRPVSDNPIDMVLTKLHEVHRFVAAQDMLTEAKAIGARKFVYMFETPPDAWIKVDDPTSTVHGPPFVTLPEAFDAQMRAKTIELLQQLGVPHERLARLGGQRWGEAEKSGVPPGEIRTRFAGPLQVYWHELGHVLDYRYHWIDQIAHDAKRPNLSGNSEIENQFRKLADLRLPDSGATAGFKKYIRTRDEKAAVMLEAYIHAPDRMKDVAPNIYSRVQKFIRNHPELQPIEDIRPNLAIGSMKQQIRIGGLVTLGHYYMPEGAAQVFNNYLSPGLQRFGIVRSFRQSTNILSGLQLGFSAFHAGFTSIDAAVSQFALGLRYLSEGKLGKAAEKITTTPLAPITNYITGRRVQRAMIEPGYGSPEIQNIARLAVQAGLRATVDPFWKTQIKRNMVRAWHEGGVQGFAGTILRAPFAMSEQLMRPILEYLVPRQKLGVFAGMAQAHMERLGPNADIYAVCDALARAADSTEDRMGQITYDNLFYNRMIRDVALLAFRAYGWTFGKYRALVGGISDVVQTPGRVRAGGPMVSDRMAYLVALPMVVAGIGSLMNYWMTGQPPQDWRDAFMPRTGGLDRHGNPQRLWPPTYIKDFLSDWHDYPNTKKMLGSFANKLNPWFAIAADLVNNADFYGTRIYNPDDPILKTLLDRAAFVIKSATPFSVTSAARLKESEPSLMQAVLPFFGFVPAKAELSMTPAQLRAAQLMYDSLPRGARTPEKAEQSRLIAELMRDMKNQDPKWRDRLNTGLLSGQIQQAQAAGLFKSLPLSPWQYQVKKLGVQDAMKVWDLANPAEREQIRAIILMKIDKAKSVSPQEKSRFLHVVTDGSFGAP